MLRKKKNTFEMNINSANAALQNIFAACDQKPNTMPFDTILLRQQANTRSYAIAKHIAELFILLLFGLPLLFPHSKAKIFTQSTHTKLTLESHYISGEQFTLDIAGGDIDYRQCYAVSADGTRYEPIFQGSSNDSIVFPYAGKEINIYIYDTSGNCLQLILTPLN